MGAKSWFKSQNETVQAGVITAVIVALGTLGAGIATGIFGILAANVSSSGHSSGTSAATASPVRSRIALGCATKLRITSPSEGTKIIGSAGVLVKGQACGLTNQEGWLFDFDYSDQYYHEDYSQSPGAAILQNGGWSFFDQPVGSQGDSSTPYAITLVLANKQCEASLLAAKPVGDDYRVRKFPAGCQVTDRRTVYVTWP